MPHLPQVHTRALVEHVDIYPTVAELAGIPVSKSEHVGGISYAGLLDSPEMDGPKRVVLTQYPRCCAGANATFQGVCTDFTKDVRCAGVPKNLFSYMGYSLRADQGTNTYRYTEWAKWNRTAFRPIWSAAPSDGVPLDPLTELYNHTGDDGRARTYELFENHNIAALPINKDIVAALSSQLRGLVESVLAERSAVNN